jgi:hypothetical protein
MFKYSFLTGEILSKWNGNTCYFDTCVKLSCEFTIFILMEKLLSHVFKKSHTHSTLFCEQEYGSP